jgi:hypothetical protein
MRSTAAAFLGAYKRACRHNISANFMRSVLDVQIKISGNDNGGKGTKGPESSFDLQDSESVGIQ